MTLPTKRSRKIVIDGEIYRWLIRSKPTYTEDCQSGFMSAAVELAGVKGATLSIQFPWQRPDSSTKINTQSVTPSMIEQCVREAIALGWCPREAGPMVQYEYKSG